MKDSKDKKTVDAFKRPVGRPSTSTSQQKRELAAERQRQFRLRKKAENALFKGIMAGDDFSKELAKAMQEKLPENYVTHVVFTDKPDHWKKLECELLAFVNDVYAPGKPYFDAFIDTRRIGFM